MGNNCVRSKTSKDGFFHNILHSMWWPKFSSTEPKNIIPNTTPNTDHKGITSSSKQPSMCKDQSGATSLHVLTKPPEPMRIITEDVHKNDIQKSIKEEPIKSKDQLSSEKKDIIVPTCEATIKREEIYTNPAVAGSKKPHDNNNNVKRLASVGLEVESVLQTKKDNIKEKYNLGNKLGHGHFGTTFLCAEKATGKEYACKSIAKRKLITKEDVEDVRREIQIMHHLSGNPNVVSIKEAYEDVTAVHLVMEQCAGGELFDRIVSKGYYSERKAAELTRTIVGVIEACHSLGVMHRDLKPENFLFVDKQEESSLKAIDFGLSVFFKPGEIFRDVVGSPYYVAPEVLRKRYGPEADVWSAGVILYILLCGVPPFWAETEQEIFEEVLHGDLDFLTDPWPSISDSAKDVVRKMLVREPKKRLTAHEVLCQPWVQIDGVAPDKPLDPAVLTRLKQFSAMNKLKKMAFKVIAQNLSEEEIAGLKEMFKMIDTDNSGQITFEELKDGLKKYGTNLSETEIHHLMQAADINNSGTIDYVEFIAAMLHINKVNREDNLFAAFSYFDKDGSGYITQDELQKACEEFGIEDVHLEEMIREVDQDNDGRIDYNEFVAMMQKGNVELGKKGLQSGSFRIGFGEELYVC